MLLWLTLCENMGEDSVQEMFANWAAYLQPPGDNEREKETLVELTDIRNDIYELMH